MAKLKYCRHSNGLSTVNDGTLNEFSNHTSACVGLVLLFAIAAYILLDSRVEYDLMCFINCVAE